MARERAVTIDELEAAPVAEDPKDKKKKKKHLSIETDANGLHYVKWEGAQGGAPIPNALKGLWTRKDKLQDKIDHHMANRQER